MFDDELELNSNDFRMFDEPFSGGASAKVYRGMYLPYCQPVACKVCPASNQTIVKQLMDEIKFQLKKLNNAQFDDLLPENNDSIQNSNSDDLFNDGRLGFCNVFFCVFFF